MTSEAEYIEKVIEQMIHYAQLDFTERLDANERSNEGDPLSGLAAGVNLMGEELKYSVGKLKEVNTALDQKNRFITSVTSAVPEIIFIVNRKNNEATYLNKCAETNSAYPCPLEVVGISDYCSHCQLMNNPERIMNDVIEGVGYDEIKVERQNKTTQWYKASITHFEKDKQGNVVSDLYTLTDISTLKVKEQELLQKEIALTNSLKEKELLLQEIHHRVKNNLQIVSGLLDMKINRISSEDIIYHLREIKSRIFSISLIHEELYQNDLFSSINLSKYIHKLCNSILGIYQNYDGTINLKYELEPNLELPLPSALPFGLLVNEIISNSFKHAFKGKKQGTIYTKLNVHNQQIVLEISDDGDGFDVEKATASDTTRQSLGMKLIKGLTLQLNGEVEITGKAGCCIKVSIPLDLSVGDTPQ